MAIDKKIISFFLLLGILTNCFNYWILSSSYAFNKAYISSVLCTNKNKPELHCEGKCFMDIKLKELEQKNKNDQENLRRMVESIAPSYISLLSPIFEISFKLEPIPYLEKVPVSNTLAIFHPPQLV